MVAFIPYVKPSFIMGIMVIINMGLGGRYIVNSLFAVIYWLISEYIYSRNYSGVGLHKVIINLSVIFGIYQFGVAGILYGPLIIILFQSVYDEVFR
jgi:predicted PurR-regulated permease PerM